MPFLTAKHTLGYCLDYAGRASEHGFRSLVVLGGDTSVGHGRCVERGWQLRQAIRQRQPELELGGWVNPHKDPSAQVGYLLESNATADFYLTQVVSNHDMRSVERYLSEASYRGLTLPGLFGVFYYRSANRRTLDALAPFLPVPREEFIRDFAAGDTARDVCARTVRALWSVGIRNIYISNLPVGLAPTVLRDVLHRADDAPPT